MVTSIEYDVSIVIVSYNTVELTKRCVQSIYDHLEDVSAEVILIDNNSWDATVACIHSAWPAVRIEENASNVGFARAVNQGVNLATGRYILLLNPDCVLVAGTVGRMLRYIESSPDVGIVGPLIVHGDERLKVASAGYLPTARSLAVHFLGLAHLPVVGRRVKGTFLMISHARGGRQDVEWVGGACLMISREDFRSLGGLSTRWFLYGEDLDLCARMIDGGRRVVHMGDCAVEHEVGASSGGASTMWIDSSQDFYILRERPGVARRVVWGVALTVGLATRAGAYGAWALIAPHGRRQLWRQQARNFSRFTIHALSIQRPGGLEASLAATRAKFGSSRQVP